MNLKAKIFLLAIVPFLLAIVGIGIGVRHQATALARTQHATTQAAYLASKEIELRHYVDLAMSGGEHIAAHVTELRPLGEFGHAETASGARELPQDLHRALH